MGSLEFDGAFLVFFAMGCLSLTMSLFLHLKNRALLRLPKSLHAEVSDRTFNVFNPYPDQRRALHSYFSLLFVVALGIALVAAYLTLMILAMGLTLGFAVLIFCLALMMFNETFDIYGNAGMLVKAANDRTGFGVGDLAVLSILKGIMPKLRVYYLLLSVAFFASSVALPYVLPAAIMALAQIVSVVLGSFAPAEGVLAAYTIVLVVVAAEMIVYVVARKAKSRIFGFPSGQLLISAMGAQARVCSYIKTTHIIDENPEETY